MGKSTHFSGQPFGGCQQKASGTHFRGDLPPTVRQIQGSEKDWEYVLAEASEMPPELTLFE